MIVMLLLEQAFLTGSLIAVGMSLRNEIKAKLTRVRIQAVIAPEEPAKVKGHKKTRQRLGGYYDDPVVNKDRGDW